LPLFLEIYSPGIKKNQEKQGTKKPRTKENDVGSQKMSSANMEENIAQCGIAFSTTLSACTVSYSNFNLIHKI